MSPSLPPPPDALQLRLEAPKPWPTSAMEGPAAAWVKAFGPELAPRFGPWGLPTLGILPPPPAAWAPTLAHSRVLLVPGGPWPGVAGDGDAWATAWALAWRARTGGRAWALRPQIWPVGQRERVLEQALKALGESPAGGPILLVGHSRGTVLVKDLAEDLQSHGQAVQAVAMLEVEAPHTGWFAREAPQGVPRLLLAENHPTCMPPPVAGQSRVYLWGPDWPHMDWVLRPPEALWRALYALLAAPTWPGPGSPEPQGHRPLGAPSPAGSPP